MASSILVSAMGADPEPPAVPGRRPRGLLAEFWYYFSENTGAVVGLAVLVLIALAAVFAPFVAPHLPDEQFRDASGRVQDFGPAWQTGSWSFPLGTDAVGRDILSRIIYGARYSLLIGLVVVTVSLSIGIL